MPFRDILSPRAIAFLTNVLDAHCLKSGITDELEREAVGGKLLALYSAGIEDPEELARMVDEVKPKEIRARRPNWHYLKN